MKQARNTEQWFCLLCVWVCARACVRACARARVCIWTPCLPNLPVYKSTSSSVDQFISWPVHQLTSSSVDQFISWPVHQFICWPVDLSVITTSLLYCSSTTHCLSVLDKSTNTQLTVCPQSANIPLCLLACPPVNQSDHLSANLPNTGLPVYRSTGLPVYRSTGLPVYRSTCLPVYRSTGLPVYRSTGLPVYRSTGLPVYRSTGLPVYRSTGLPVYRSTGLYQDFHFNYANKFDVTHLGASRVAISRFGMSAVYLVEISQIGNAADACLLIRVIT